MDKAVSNLDRVIIGIDPGTNMMGYAILGICGNKPHMVAMGVIELDKIGDHYTRLGRIYQRVTMLVEQYCPDEMAIEAPFFGKNVQSMLKLGRAQGVAIAAAISRQVPIAAKNQTGHNRKRRRLQRTGPRDAQAYPKHTAGTDASEARQYRCPGCRSMPLL